ncbi:MAG: 50S ribosomal protein L19 [bacterium]|nr:50S ribosomal protein L19 [bacterium]
MTLTKQQQFTKSFLKTDMPEIKVGDTVKLHQKIKEGEKERIQIFEGVVIAQKHGKGVSGSMIVRKIIDGVGVEKMIPLHSPNLVKVEIIAHGKTRRAKLYFLRDRIGKKSKLKRKEINRNKSLKVPETVAEQTPEQTEA